jgi:periplasmic iron binding protein
VTLGPGTWAVHAAAEFYIGEPIEKEGMQFAPAYLTGIQMDRHPAGMSMDPKETRIEIDIHAAKGEKHGFAEDAWIPDHTVKLTSRRSALHTMRPNFLRPWKAEQPVACGR